MRPEAGIRVLPSRFGRDCQGHVDGRGSRNPNGFGGRVITGVAQDEEGNRTPLALAVPAQLVVEFDLGWAEILSAAL